MKLVSFFVLLLALGEQITARKITKELINELERKMSKFLTHPNDVVHMKVLFDERQNSQNNDHALTNLNSINRVARRLSAQRRLKSAQNRNSDWNKELERNVSMYNFKTGKRVANKWANPRRRSTKLTKRRHLIDDKFPQNARSGLGELGKQLGINTGTDAVLAGAGTAAMFYGSQKHKENKKEIKAALELLQQRYLDKKAFKEQLKTEVHGLKELAHEMEEINAKTNTTMDEIAASFDNRMMFGDTDGY